MPEEKGLLTSLTEAGGGIAEAALTSGLPASLISKNPATVLAEQATGLIAVGGLVLVSTIAVVGIVVALNQQDDEKNNSQPNYFIPSQQQLDELRK